MTKVVHCECGTDVEAESDDELVTKVEEHVAESHPDLVGKLILIASAPFHQRYVPEIMQTRLARLTHPTSRTEWPACSCSRYRVTMSSA